MRRIVLLFLLAVGGLLPSVAWPGLGPVRSASVGSQPVVLTDQNAKNSGRRSLSKNARVAFIRRAQVWSPTNIPSMDLRSGPGGAGAFQPNEQVVCDYTDSNMHGATQKFHCRLANGDVVKV